MKIQEAMKIIRINTLLLAEKRKFILGVVSCLPGEGKTFLSSNLAIAFAQAGFKTLLVDLNLRHPKIHEVFGLKQKPGFVDAVVAELEPEEVVQIYQNKVELHVLTGGPIHPSQSEFISSDETKSFIAGLTRKWDVVVVDLPPAIPVSDAMALADVIDYYIVVADIRRVKKPQLNFVKKQLETAGAKILGVVVNFVSKDIIPTIYYYSYYYYYPTEKRKKYIERILHREQVQ